MNAFPLGGMRATLRRGSGRG